MKKGSKMSKESKRKISSALMGNKLALGFKHSEETKKKIAEAQRGKHHSEETKKKMRKNNIRATLGKHHSEETRKKMRGRIPWNKGKKRPPFSKEWIENLRKASIKAGCRPPSVLGKKLTEKHKRKVSEANKGRKRLDMVGNKNPKWQGGISFKPYTPEWTKTLKLAIRQRDNFTCQKCGITEEEHLRKFKEVLSVNHIDYNKKNCDLKNLNTLCRSCNSSVNTNREYWTNFFKQKLCLV